MSAQLAFVPQPSVPPRRTPVGGQDYPWPHHPECVYLMSKGLEWCNCRPVELPIREQSRPLTMETKYWLKCTLCDWEENRVPLVNVVLVAFGHLTTEHPPQIRHLDWNNGAVGWHSDTLWASVITTREE